MTSNNCAAISLAALSAGGLNTTLTTTVYEPTGSIFTFATNPAPLPNNVLQVALQNEAQYGGQIIVVHRTQNYQPPPVLNAFNPANP
jgi:hypothetical protein